MAGEMHPMQSLTLANATLAEKALRSYFERKLLHVQQPYDREQLDERAAASEMLERCSAWQARQARSAV